MDEEVVPARGNVRLYLSEHEVDPDGNRLRVATRRS
jgi:hypothetical protein